MERKRNQSIGVTSSVVILLSLLQTVNAAQWASEPSLNMPRVQGSAVVCPCGDIYISGGQISWSAPQRTNTVEKLAFDGSEYAEAWAYASPMPVIRETHASMFVGGFIYVMGGIGESGTLSSVDRYDTTNDTWETGVVPDLMTGRGYVSATVDKLGRIYVVGGKDAGGMFLSSVERYDPSRPELGWVALPALNEARGYAGVVTDNAGVIYAFGGHGVSGHIRTVERFDPCDEETGWTVLPELIPGTASNIDEAVLGTDGRIYIAGGWLPGLTNRVVRFDPETETWEDWVPLSRATANVSLVLGGNKRIFVMGGNQGHTSASTVVESLTAPLGQFDPNGDGVIDGLDIQAFLIAILDQ